MNIFYGKDDGAHFFAFQKPEKELTCAVSVIASAMEGRGYPPGRMKGVILLLLFPNSSYLPHVQRK